jgi:hypothetical protein
MFSCKIDDYQQAVIAATCIIKQEIRLAKIICFDVCMVILFGRNISFAGRWRIQAVKG